MEQFEMANRRWEQEKPSSVWRLEVTGGGITEVQQIDKEYKLYRVID